MLALRQEIAGEKADDSVAGPVPFGCVQPKGSHWRKRRSRRGKSLNYDEDPAKPPLTRKEIFSILKTDNRPARKTKRKKDGARTDRRLSGLPLDTKITQSINV